MSSTGRCNCRAGDRGCCTASAAGAAGGRAATTSSSGAAPSMTAGAARPIVGDVAIKGDRIVYVGPLRRPRRRGPSTRSGLAVVAGLHQHAQLGDRIADRRSARRRATCARA